MSNPKPFQARQGDLFFQEITELPKTKLTPKKDAVLAHGEATGHCHKVTDLSKVEMFVDEEGHIFLQPSQDTVIEHNEHGPITLAAGKSYCMTRQREFDPVEEQRRVAD